MTEKHAIIRAIMGKGTYVFVLLPVYICQAVLSSTFLKQVLMRKNALSSSCMLLKKVLLKRLESNSGCQAGLGRRSYKAASLIVS